MGIAWKMNGLENRVSRFARDKNINSHISSNPPAIIMQNQLKNIRIKLVRIGQYGQKLDHSTFNNLCSIPPINIKPSSDNGILVDVPGKFLPQAYNIFRDPMLSQLRKAGYTPIRTHFSVASNNRDVHAANPVAALIELNTISFIFFR